MTVKEFFGRKIRPREIARQLDISTQSIYQTLERDISKCEIGTVQRIAKTLGLSIELKIQ